MTACAVLGLLALVSVSAGAQGTPQQTTIPVRQLSEPDGITREKLGLPFGIVQFANGRVIVNDVAHRKLLFFDPTLSTFTITADSSGTGATLYPNTFQLSSLYYYLGDTAAFTDRSTETFVLIGPDGKLGRAMAHPKSRDMSSISAPYSGSPAFDAQGRFIYRGGGGFIPFHPAPKPGEAPRTRDTSSLVRADFESRVVDTVAPIVLPALARSPVVWDDRGKASATTVINPVPPSPDEWAVLSGGSIAIVSPHDYHIDWVLPDGSRKSTPKMPFDWRRLTEADKQAKIDSIKHIIDSVNATGKPYGMIIAGRAGQAKPDSVKPTIVFVPYADMGDYVPAVRPGAVKADRDNHLWILPTTTISAAGGGLLYDVVNTDGVIFERIQLPPGCVVAGFGPGAIVYLQSGDRTSGYTLEKRHLPKGPAQ